MRKKTTEEVKKEIYDLVGDEYTLVGEYEGTNIPVKLYHKTCGNVYSVRLRHFLRANRRCSYCYGNHKKTTEEFKREVKKLVGDDYTVLGEYKGSHKYIKMKHNICDHEWNVKPTYFVNSQATRCPKCFKNNSSSETELRDFIIETLGIENVKFNDRSLIYYIDDKDNKVHYYEIDIYIPKIKLAIEFDGIFWHSSKYTDKDYHINKTKLCNEKDIKLIHVFEDEWLLRKDIVKSLLLKELNLLESKTIKKYYIKEISVKEKNRFLKENSLEFNKYKTDLRLGLYINKELYSILTVRNNKIINYIDRKDIKINNSLELFIKYIRSNITNKKIYIDFNKRWYDKNDNIFKNLIYIEDIKPKKFYFDTRFNNDIVICHKEYNKILYKDVVSTEKESIYDCGYIRYKIP